MFTAICSISYNDAEREGRFTRSTSNLKRYKTMKTETNLKAGTEATKHPAKVTVPDLKLQSL